MTDRELAQAAEDHLRRTTISYPEWVKRKNAGRYTPPDGSTTEWGKAFASIEQIDIAAPPPGDTQAPIAPRNLRTTTVTQTTVALAWDPATDNIGVVNYRIYRNNTLIGQGAGSSGGASDAWTDSGRTAGTAYSYQVEAVDAAGNVSPRATLSVTTLPADAPPPPPTGGILEINGGTYTGQSYATLLSQAPSGPLTVRPKPGATVIVQGGASVRNDLTTEGIRFDGQGRVHQIWMTDVVRWKFRNCTFERFHGASIQDHSEALYIGGGCRDGVVEGCTFNDNGSTAHIFFTWFGSSQGGGAYDINNHPRNICVRGNTFGPTHGAYFDVDFRSEIPSSAGIRIDPDNVMPHGISRPEFRVDC